jgi:hypothetical protein
MTRARWCFLAVPFACLSCSLILSFDGLTTGGNAAPDATSPDVISPESGSPDSPVTGFCAGLHPQPAFCTDFDESTSLPAGWDGLIVDGANGVLDQQIGKSPPGSLYATHAAASGSTQQSGYLLKTMTAGVSEIDLDYDVMFDSDSYFAVISSIMLSGGYSAGITIDGLLEELRPQFEEVHFNGLSVQSAWGNWIHVQMVLVLPKAATGGSLTVRFRNGSVETLALDHRPVTAAAASGTPSIKLGIVNSNLKWGAHFDNVTVNVSP